MTSAPTRHTLAFAAILLMALGALCVPAGAQPAAQPPMTDVERFAAEVDFNQLGMLAVNVQGRLKSYGSHSQALMRLVSGPRRINGQRPEFTYLDLMLRPRAYEDVDLIFVRNKNIREMIANALIDSVQHNVGAMLGGGHPPIQGSASEEVVQFVQARMEQFMRTGLIAPRMLHDPAVAHLLAVLRQDLVRTAKPVEEIEVALGIREERVLRSNLRVVPPPGGGFYDRWLTIEEFALLEDSGVDRSLRNRIAAHWQDLQAAWRRLDAAGVNEASAHLVALIPQVNADLFEENIGRTGWPWTYTADSSWKWITSVGLGVISALLAGIFVFMRRPTGAALAIAGVGAAALFHISTVQLSAVDPLVLESWYFNARNMTWVWLFYAASLIPLLLSIVFRWKGAQWAGLAMFMLAFGFHTAAVLVRWYVSGRWPNSNMFEAVTTAAWWGGIAAIILEVCVRRSPMRSMFALCSAVASMVALMVAHFTDRLDPSIRNMMPVLHDVWLYIHVNVTILSYAFIFMAAVTAALYLLYRFIGSFMGMNPRHEFARMGGAASLIMKTPSGETYIQKPRTSFGQVLDGTTMILVELSFVLLWAGTVMGAIWADHSWGRPWGWDPKEVFALNTFIVFVALIHVRLKVLDKGFWTAIIALIGAAVMLFNWIAINFVVVGLHSYA